ncbi:MAG: aldo/keto reductase [Flavobacterium lindanitolerans]|uniref:aldo/keto reductase n=1 Tax=Flavobacterium lindanitolerans TaxID=428988 RepID=UPI001A5917A7|nr:aldo/keto reductase [Flavobacterium lindanitolerans]MBL7869959.1 aldo/keto reductase [Flavobacterium lindanitolerans]
MKYNQLGKSGLLVSELCFGTMSFGSSGYWSVVGSLDYKDSKRLVDIALDAGINYFDTADVYSHGQSEEILGKALKDKRNEVVIATKVRGRMSKEINNVGLSRKHIIESCDNSLRRLGTDYIDHYIVHSFDPITPLEETLSALTDLVRQGKVRYLGASNFTGWQLMKALAISKENHFEKFVSLQAIYSLISRDVEYELIPVCQDQGLGLTPWSPLGGGFLTGKYRKDQPMPEGTRRSNEEQNFIQIDPEKGYAIVDALEQIANKNNATIAQAALNYLLRKPIVSSVLIGATKPHQIEDNIKATTWEMTTEDVVHLDELTKLTPIYPHWMLQFTAADRTNGDFFF